MTEEEEFRFFEGPWPWCLSGLIVTCRGVLIGVPPQDDPVLSDSPSDIYRKNREEAWEDFGTLDPQELYVRINLTRDQLSDEWMIAKRLGEKVESRFEQFRDWVSERIGPHIDTGPTSESKDEADAASPIRRDVWHKVIRSKSHVIAEGAELERQVQQLNRIAVRYRVLRTMRRAEALGSSEEVVPPKTKRFAEIAAGEIGEEGVKTQTGVCRGVAASVDDARRTVERWLIDENPLYKSLGDSQSEKYRALKRAVERVNQKSDLQSLVAQS